MKKRVVAGTLGFAFMVHIAEFSVVLSIIIVVFLGLIAKEE